MSFCFFFLEEKDEEDTLRLAEECQKFTSAVFGSHHLFKVVGLLVFWH